MLFLKKIFSTFYKKFTFELFVTLVGIGGQFAPYMQAFKIFELQSNYAVSLTAALISFSSMLVWFAYGMSRKVKPLIISNVVGIIGMLLVLGGIFYYR